MKHVFVLNPAAGTGDMIEPLKEKIKSACGKLGADYTIYLTNSRGDAREYVKRTVGETSEKTRFYACGGDGTLGEVVGGAIGSINAEVGLVPIGTGNDFVRNFGHAEDFFDIEKQLCGEAGALDVIKCNDIYGINELNVGFDCNVVEKMEELRGNKFVPSKMRYGASVAINFFKKFGTKMKITADGETFEGDMTLCAVGNGGYYGGGFNALPKSKTNDGLLDVCIVGKVSRAKFVSLLGPYKTGAHLENKASEDCITYRQCKSVRIELEEERFFCIDGELEKMKGVDIELVHKAIMFSVPASSQSTEIKKSAAAETSI